MSQELWFATLLETAEQIVISLTPDVIDTSCGEFIRLAGDSETFGDRAWPQEQWQIAAQILVRFEPFLTFFIVADSYLICSTFINTDVRSAEKT
jgi:hypothetical protein